MNINIQREIDYTSKLFPDVKMKLRNLTSSQYKKSVTYHPAKKNKKPQLEFDLDIMFDCMVFDITNLTVTDEKKEVVEIKTGKDVIDSPGLNDLYLELSSVLLKMEARVDAKN